MVHVAREMAREGFAVPLLIGGATTSKAHTAVKIAPAYERPVVHVLDASRAVGVVGALMSPEQQAGFAEKNRRDQEQVRHAHKERGERTLLTLAEARLRRAPILWRAADIPKPAFTGVRVLDRFPLEPIVPFIDWSPFFHTWELRGRYPKILEDPTVGAKAGNSASPASAAVILPRGRRSGGMIGTAVSASRGLRVPLAAALAAGSSR